MKNEAVKPVLSETADITIEKAEHLKGIALVFLLWHHLFGIGCLSGWSSVIPGLEDVTYIIGQSSRICLAIFLAVSGFGIYKSYINKESPPKHYVFIRLVKTLIPYWIVMLFTIAYLACTGKFKPENLFVNLFALLGSDAILYITFSWFIKLYILIVLLSPFIRMIEQKWRKNLLLDILIYIAFPLGVTLGLGNRMNESNFKDIPSFLLSSVLLVFAWFPLWAAGMLFAKYNIYNRVRKIADKIPDMLIIGISFITFCYVFFLRYFIYEKFYSWLIFSNCMLDVIFGPLIIVSLLLLVDKMKSASKLIIPFIGRNAIFYWLLSGIFFANTCELRFIILWPKISILIFLWTLLILTPVVFCCSWITKKLIKFIKSKTKA